MRLLLLRLSITSRMRMGLGMMGIIFRRGLRMSLVAIVRLSMQAICDSEVLLGHMMDKVWARDSDQSQECQHCGEGHMAIPVRATPRLFRLRKMSYTHDPTQHTRLSIANCSAAELPVYTCAKQCSQTLQTVDRVQKHGSK